MTNDYHEGLWKNVDVNTRRKAGRVLVQSFSPALAKSSFSTEKIKVMKGFLEEVDDLVVVSGTRADRFPECEMSRILGRYDKFTGWDDSCYPGAYANVNVPEYFRMKIAEARRTLKR